jgi:uncharacterized protein YggE
MAIRAAQEKAKLLAGEIGQSIGPAYSITEFTPDYGRASGTLQMQNANDSIGGASSGGETAIAPGSISITAQVTVRFRLM